MADDLQQAKPEVTSHTITYLQPPCHASELMLLHEEMVWMCMW